MCSVSVWKFVMVLMQLILFRGPTNGSFRVLLKPLFCPLDSHPHKINIRFLRATIMLLNNTEFKMNIITID
jgi:hypothetical protein